MSFLSFHFIGRLRIHYPIFAPLEKLQGSRGGHQATPDVMEHQRDPDGQLLIYPGAIAPIFQDPTDRGV